MRQPFGQTILGAMAALALAVPAGVWAHHSSANFDPSRSLTLQGVVKQFRWANPHAAIQVLVLAGEGREDEWSIEMSSPEHLARAGWQFDSLAAGDAVSLVVHPMRDDAKRGLFVSGTGPRGPLIDEVPPASASAQILLLDVANPSCPRVEVTQVEASRSAETRPVKLGGLSIFVRRDAITTTSDISEFKVAGDALDAVIQIRYEAEAAARLQDATTDRDGLQLAFVVDDDVWLAFTWRGPYGIGSDGTQLSIRNGLAKAKQLLESLRACSDTPTR